MRCIAYGPALGDECSVFQVLARLHYPADRVGFLLKVPRLVSGCFLIRVDVHDELVEVLVLRDLCEGRHLVGQAVEISRLDPNVCINNEHVCLEVGKGMGLQFHRSPVDSCAGRLVSKAGH
jgi:hypothetical protein